MVALDILESFEASSLRCEPAAAQMQLDKTIKDHDLFVS